jgi:Protein of unknown function (DUF2934)
MARKTSSRSGRSTRSTRPVIQVSATTPNLKPDMGADAPQAQVLELHVAPPASSSTTAVESWHEQIARRAYELFLSRGGVSGDPFHDWLRAERELQQSRAA